MLKLNALDILNHRQVDSVAPHIAKIKLADVDLFGSDPNWWEDST